MKTAQAAPSAPVPAPQVCRPIHIHSLPGVPGNLLRYTPLFREVRKEELARIIGGAAITETTLRSAEEMLAK